MTLQSILGNLLYATNATRNMATNLKKNITRESLASTLIMCRFCLAVDNLRRSRLAGVAEATTITTISRRRMKRNDCEQPSSSLRSRERFLLMPRTLRKSLSEPVRLDLLLRQGRRKALCELVRLILVRNDKRVQVAAAPDLELHLKIILLRQRKIRLPQRQLLWLSRLRKVFCSKMTHCHMRPGKKLI